MKNDVFAFISYSRRDIDFVNRLSNDLQSAGVRIWRDVEQIQAGDNWEQAIKTSISNASVMLFVVSHHTVTSSWMEKEFVYFAARKLPVIPLLLDDAGIERMPPALAKFQWLDFRQDYQKALGSLLSAIHRLVREDHPIERKSAQTKGYVFFNYAERTRILSKT
jgi:hypothetical protein